MHEDKKRVVLLHGHMFKNAGTSIDKILKDNFGEGFVDHREDEKMIKGGQRYVEEYLHTHPEIKALSSHHLPLPLKNTDLLEFKTIVMLRNPIVRVASVYRFERQQVANTPGAIAAKRHNIADYVKWRLAQRPGTICNYFTSFLTSSLALKEGRNEYDAAMRVLDQIFFVGIVEQFEESIQLLSNKLGPYFVGLKIKNVRENITDSRELSSADRVKLLEKEIGPVLYARLLAENQSDIAIYENVRQKQIERVNRGQIRC